MTRLSEAKRWSRTVEQPSRDRPPPGEIDCSSATSSLPLSQHAIGLHTSTEGCSISNRQGDRTRYSLSFWPLTWQDFEKIR